MKYALVTGGVVDVVSDVPQDGFVECASSVLAGFVYDAQADTFTAPVPPAISAADEREAMRLTDIQFSLICVARGWMTQAEAQAWVGNGTLPALAVAAIASLPVDQQGAGTIRFMGARIIDRLDPFLPFLQAAASPQITDTELDQAFRDGAAL